MNIPERIDLTVLRQDEETKKLAPQVFNVPFEFNFNATNDYRKNNNIEYSDFVVLFGGLTDGNFAANEAVIELFWYAIKEGCRICFEEMPAISVQDVGRFLNSDMETFTTVISSMGNSMESPEDGKPQKKNLTEKETK